MTRHYGGIKLGKRRFDLAKDLSRDAITHLINSRLDNDTTYLVKDMLSAAKAVAASNHHATKSSNSLESVIASSDLQSSIAHSFNQESAGNTMTIPSPTGNPNVNSTNLRMDVDSAHLSTSDDLDDCDFDFNFRSLRGRGSRRGKTHPRKEYVTPHRKPGPPQKQNNSMPNLNLLTPS